MQKKLKLYVVLHRDKNTRVHTHDGVDYGLSVRGTGGYYVFGTRSEAFRACTSSDKVFVLNASVSGPAVTPQARLITQKVGDPTHVWDGSVKNRGYIKLKVTKK